MSQLFFQDDSDDEELQTELSRQIEGLKDIQPEIESANNKEKNKTVDEEKKFELKQTEDEKLLYPLIPNDKYGDDQLKPNLDDIRAVNINLTLPLSFQQQLVEDILVTDDPLVILGKGLCMASIIANLLHILSTPTNVNGQQKRSLVLVLNAKPEDNQQISEELQELFWLSDDNEEMSDFMIDTCTEDNPRPFNVVSADSISVDKRRQLYLGGGIISVTSRILIVDLLSGIIHPNRITGMIILNVENLRHYSNESFITEIYRSKNKWGFINGFSESPESFTMEFSPLKRKLKELHLKNVLLWPRFRVEISACLNSISQQNTKVIEIKVSLTNSMSQIQFGLMECLKKCIAELNRKNTELALDWWNIENALDVNFQRSIDAVMMPNWHRISYESKQLIKDIRFLRQLMKDLVTKDAVDFYEEIQLSLEANKPSVSRKYIESPWLMADESQLVISHSRKRIYDNAEYQLEEMPKWEQLINILEDINYQKITKPTSGPTLIVCSDSSLCRQLTTILCSSNRNDGLKKMMQLKLRLYKIRKEERQVLVQEVNEKETKNETELTVSTAFAKDPVVSKRRRTRGASSVAAVERLRTAGASEDIEGAIDGYQIDENIEEALVDPNFVEIQDDDDLNYYDEYDETNEPTFLASRTSKDLWDKITEDFHYVDCEDQVIVQKFSDLSDDSLLQEMRPSNIIMYEPDLTFIRKVEIFRAINEDLSPNVYFMYYGDSIEEQRHLTVIKKEKDAFTKLIRENAMRAHHFETEGDLSHFKNLADRKLKLSRLRNNSTRIAGGQASLQEFTQDIVIVDTREFSASLPGLLFRYGVCVIPCMLTVGDYILTPDICVERKSISDLIGSLQNKRLDSQCKKMTKYYKYPALLIEFNEGQSFSLEPFSEKRSYKSKELSTVHPISNKLSQDEIQMKLAKLVIKFPALKIIWSSSPLQTINIILELKTGRQQPDPSESVAIGAGKLGADFSINCKNATLTNDEKFAKLLEIQSLSKIDYFNIRKKIKSYQKLRNLSLQDLIDLLNDEGLANTVFNYIQSEELSEEHYFSD